MEARRQARSATLEALYEIDAARHDPVEVVARHLEEDGLNPSGSEFLTEVVTGVVQHSAMMDELITEYAPDWPLDQMAFIDRNILRMAIFEFLYQSDTPVKVAINEAVELAKNYGSDSAPRFINGVLGTLAGQLPRLQRTADGTSEQTDPDQESTPEAEPLPEQEPADEREQEQA